MAMTMLAAAQIVQPGQQTMQTGHADIGDAIHPGSGKLKGLRGFFSDRQIRGPGAHDGHRGRFERPSICPMR
jgi:hypothetical protein